MRLARVKLPVATMELLNSKLVEVARRQSNEPDNLIKQSQLISPIAALCLSLFGLLCGLVVARVMLVRSLSASGKHLSKMESFIEELPLRISGVTTGNGANTTTISSTSAVAADGSLGISTVYATTCDTTSGSTTTFGSSTTAGFSTASGSNTTSGSNTLTEDQATASGLATTAGSNTTSSTNSNTASGATSGSLSVSTSHQPLPNRQPAGTTKAVALVTQSSRPYSQTLKPAEIAFLIRGGDLNHTIIVLTVDLIQRAIKANTTSFSETLADYERSMWRIVTRSVKDWASQKVQQTVVSGAKNPVAAARRIVFLYNFIRNSLRGLIADTIADPRHLKKYFSPTGVIRIFIDFTSQGYKQTFQEELRKSLLRRGLLVPEAARESVGKRFFAIGVVGLIATLITAYCFLPNGAVAFITWFAALAGGFAARTLLALRHLVPYFDEIAVVVGQVRRKSFRLTIVKILLRSVSAISWLALALSLGLTLSFGFIFIKAFSASAGWTDFGALAAMTIANFAIADFVFNGVRLNIDECPTRIAEKQLEQMRKELEHVSPLETFRTMLASPNYDPTFSKILALYGIETLLILI